MKRIMFLLVTVFMIGTVVMAQGNRRSGGERNQDPKVRAEKMTERMVKEYSLNDTQKGQLMELNLTMAEKMKDKPAMRHHRGKKGDKCECNSCDCKSKDKKEAGEKVAKADKKTTDKDVERGNAIKKRLEMKESRESYNAKLKDIMTKDQYDAYSKKQADREQKMKERQNNRKRS